MTLPVWLAKLLRWPPQSLAFLENFVGAIDIDWNGYEGRGGGSVTRPDCDRTGALQPEIAAAWFSFENRLLHHHGPTDLGLRSLRLVLDVPFADLRAALVQRCANDGREFDRADRDHQPMIEWFLPKTKVSSDDWSGYFYLEPQRDGCAFECHASRPEWARPTVIAPSPREDLLATLLDRLVCDDKVEAVATALAPLVGEANARTRVYGVQLEIAFDPRIELAVVTRVLRWERPVALSTSDNRENWVVVPWADAQAHRPPAMGVWTIRVWLDGRPKAANAEELPNLGGDGPRAVLDLATSVTKVEMISIERPR